MNINEFKELISQEFGDGMEHATPGNVREFLDRMNFGVLNPDMKGRLILEEYASSYEEIMKDFFIKVLDMPRDDAIILLWLLAFDFAFSAIEIQQEERFRSLFEGCEE